MAPFKKPLTTKNNIAQWDTAIQGQISESVSLYVSLSAEESNFFQTSVYWKLPLDQIDFWPNMFVLIFIESLTQTLHSANLLR